VEISAVIVLGLKGDYQKSGTKLSKILLSGQKVKLNLMMFKEITFF